MALIPVEVAFRGLPHSDRLESAIRERVAWLEQFHPGIVRCHVVVELPHRHRQDGRHFHVRVETTVPGRPPIVVDDEPSLHAQAKHAGAGARHKDTDVDSDHRYAAVAIRQAFDAARRRLEDVARRQRGAVKSHDVPQ